jgi:predicted phosphodiesterase
MSDIHMNHSHNTVKIWRKFFRKKLRAKLFDIIVVAGDIASVKQKDLNTFFGLLREFFPNHKVFWVKGNHDFYDRKSWFRGSYNADERRRKPITREWNYYKILEYHKKLCNQYNLIHLDGSFEELNKDIVLFGFDGWYGYKPITNDVLMIPDNLKDNSLLRNKAHDDLNNILNTVEKYYQDEGVIKICMTHFPPYTFQPQYKHMIANENYLKFIAEEFDYLLLGHSHRDEDWNFKGCRIINTGSDYDKPQAKIIDVVNGESETIK